MDTPWWNVHHGEVQRVFRGLRVRGSGSAQSNLAIRATFGQGCLNSGAGALLMARSYGAGLIIMLGYDCQAGENGAKHWHANHGHGLGNAGMLHKWPKQFADVAPKLEPARVINATRSTALTIWECMALEKALSI